MQFTSLELLTKRVFSSLSLSRMHFGRLQMLKRHLYPSGMAMRRSAWLQGWIGWGKMYSGAATRQPYLDEPPSSQEEINFRNKSLIRHSIKDLLSLSSRQSYGKSELHIIASISAAIHIYIYIFISYICMSFNEAVSWTGHKSDWTTYDLLWRSNRDLCEKKKRQRRCQWHIPPTFPHNGDIEHNQYAYKRKKF